MLLHKSKQYIISITMTTGAEDSRKCNLFSFKLQHHNIEPLNF